MLPAAPFFDSRQRHAELAGAKDRVAPCHVECAGQPHGTCKSSKHALRDMKGGVLVLAPGGPLDAGNQQRVASDHDVHSVRLDADEIDDYFDASRRFDDIERNAALRGMRAGVNSSELFDQSPEVIVRFAPFDEDASHESILSL